MGNVNRASVPLKKWNEEKQLRTRLTKLYRQFFFSDELSVLESKIEYMYLEAKFEKYTAYQNIKVRLPEGTFAMLLEYTQ